MDIKLQELKGTFVVAVSGGVDSVVLLDLLHKSNSDNNYIVAHVNHGIRQDAFKDSELVERLANLIGYKFESTELALGDNASEEIARNERYQYLYTIADKYNARAVITAHHQDDAIETLFINIVRGTGRRGLSSLGSHKRLIRPLLHYSKAEIYDYANRNRLEWREDTTNMDKNYLRNKIRHDVVTLLDSTQRKQIIDIIQNTHKLNDQIDLEIRQLLRKGLHKGTLVLNRLWFCQLPHDIAAEVVYVLLRQSNAKEIDKKTIEKVVVAIKTMYSGKTLQISGVDIVFTKRSARFISRSKTE